MIGGRLTLSSREKAGAEWEAASCKQTSITRTGIQTAAHHVTSHHITSHHRTQHEMTHLGVEFWTTLLNDEGEETDARDKNATLGVWDILAARSHTRTRTHAHTHTHTHKHTHMHSLHDKRMG